MSLARIEYDKRGCEFSEDKKYRWSLYRFWTEGPRILFAMHNPSDADFSKWPYVTDPTQERIADFSKRLGYGGLYVWNLYGYRTPYPRVLKTIEDPIGELNDQKLLELLGKTEITVGAWGCQNNKKFHERAESVKKTLLSVRPIYCLETSKDGCPRHPLYLKHTLKLKLL